MSSLKKYFPKIVKLFSLFGGLFLIGFLLAREVLYVVFSSAFAFIFIIPILVSLAIAIGTYIAVGYFINYYFKDISYNQRLLLTALGVSSIFFGIYMGIFV